MVELLETPVVDGPIGLEKKVLSYAMTDETLEGLSPAQKQLLRMGPKGVRAVHGKIREMAAALGVPGSRLPQPKTTRPARIAPGRGSLPAEGLFFPEIRDEVFVRPEGLRLEEQMAESESEGLVGGPTIFLRRHAPLDLLRRLETGMVLAHQAEADERGEVPADPVQNGERVVGRARQDEVADDEPLAGRAVAGR